MLYKTILMLLGYINHILCRILTLKTLTLGMVSYNVESYGKVKVSKALKLNIQYITHW